MKIKFFIGTEAGGLYIQREEGDPKAKASGFTRNVHGWGAEIHLLHLIKTALNALGFNLCCVRLATDSHLMGDDHMKYLRTPKAALKKSHVGYPYMYIVDEGYAVRSSAEAYNKGEEVHFRVHGNVFKDDYPQPRWWLLVKALCEDHIPCELSEEAQKCEGCSVHYASNEYGYQVVVCCEGKIVKEYTAGNSHHESQGYLEPGSMGAANRSQILAWAKSTAGEFAEEYGGCPVEYDSDLEPGLEDLKTLAVGV